MVFLVAGTFTNALPLAANSFITFTIGQRHGLYRGTGYANPEANCYVHFTDHILKFKNVQLAPASALTNAFWINKQIDITSLLLAVHFASTEAHSYAPGALALAVFNEINTCLNRVVSF
jgi:hypothetical protein